MSTWKGESEDSSANTQDFEYKIEVCSYDSEMSEGENNLEENKDCKGVLSSLLSSSSAHQGTTTRVKEEAPSSAGSRDRSRSPIESYSSESLLKLELMGLECGVLESEYRSSDAHRPSAARCALIMGLVKDEPDVPAVPPPSYLMVEKVEAADLTDEEVDETAMDHVRKWLRGSGSSSGPLAASPAAEDSLHNFPAIASVYSLETNMKPGSVGSVASVDAHVRQSCSGMTATSKRGPSRKECGGSELDSDFDDEFGVLSIQPRGITGAGKDIPDDDDLEEPIRNIIHSVARAMDEAIDNLPDISNSFKWEEDFGSFQGVPEEFSGPTPGPLNDYDTPYEAFIDIWSKDLIGLIAQETNRYASQTIDHMKTNGLMKRNSRLHQWIETDADEILLLFAVYIFMGIDPRTSQNEYWKDVGYLTLSKFKELMSYDRYILLSKFLHFVDNSELCQDHSRYSEYGISPKLAKLAPVISHLNEKFTSLYNLHRKISIDESLTLFEGRLSWIQTIRTTKSARFGIKSYELCESQTGYMHKFQIYTGENCDNHDTVASSADLGGKSTRMVLELLQGLEHRGHTVTMDNFYNCPSLARYLKSKGFDCLGTLRAHRKNVPDEIAKAPEDASKGTIIARHSGDVSVVAWKDTRWVTMISTYHGSETYVGWRAGRHLVKPVSVKDYNRITSGVDMKDQHLSMYLVDRKRCVKWYVKMFKRLLNVSIHNAFVMHGLCLTRRGMSPVTQREFRYALANSLAEHHRRVQPVVRGPAMVDMRLRRDVVHVPNKRSGANSNKRCVVHQRQDISKMVHTKCDTCNAFMCLGDCWLEWHSQPQLKGREIRGRKRKRT